MERMKKNSRHGLLMTSSDSRRQNPHHSTSLSFYYSHHSTSGRKPLNNTTNPGSHPWKSLVGEGGGGGGGLRDLKRRLFCGTPYYLYGFGESCRVLGSYEDEKEENLKKNYHPPRVPFPPPPPPPFLLPPPYETTLLLQHGHPKSEEEEEAREEENDENRDGGVLGERGGGQREDSDVVSDEGGSRLVVNRTGKVLHYGEGGGSSLYSSLPSNQTSWDCLPPSIFPCSSKKTSHSGGRNAVRVDQGVKTRGGGGGEGGEEEQAEGGARGGGGGAGDDFFFPPCWTEREEDTCFYGGPVSQGEGGGGDHDSNDGNRSTRQGGDEGEVAEEEGAANENHVENAALPLSRSCSSLDPSLCTVRHISTAGSCRGNPLEKSGCIYSSLLLEKKGGLVFFSSPKKRKTLTKPPFRGTNKASPSASSSGIERDLRELELKEYEKEKRLVESYKPLFIPVDPDLQKKFLGCTFLRGDLRFYPKKTTQYGEVHYSPRYQDDRYVYRHVLLSSGVRKAAEEMARHHSTTGFLSEEQFIYQLGIDLSPGWQHFMRFKGRLRELILRRPPTVEEERRDGAPTADDEMSVESDDSTDYEKEFAGCPGGGGGGRAGGGGRSKASCADCDDCGESSVSSSSSDGMVEVVKAGTSALSSQPTRHHSTDRDSVTETEEKPAHKEEGHKEAKEEEEEEGGEDWTKHTSEGKTGSSPSSVTVGSDPLCLLKKRREACHQYPRPREQHQSSPGSTDQAYHSTRRNLTSSTRHDQPGKTASTTNTSTSRDSLPSPVPPPVATHPRTGGCDSPRSRTRRGSTVQEHRRRRRHQEGEGCSGSAMPSVSSSSSSSSSSMGERRDEGDSCGPSEVSCTSKSRRSSDTQGVGSEQQDEGRLVQAQEEEQEDVGGLECQAVQNEEEKINQGLGVKDGALPAEEEQEGTSSVDRRERRLRVLSYRTACPPYTRATEENEEKNRISDEEEKKKSRVPLSSSSSSVSANPIVQGKQSIDNKGTNNNPVDSQPEPTYPAPLMSLSKPTDGKEAFPSTVEKCPTAPPPSPLVLSDTGETGHSRLYEKSRPDELTSALTFIAHSKPRPSSTSESFERKPGALHEEASWPTSTSTTVSSSPTQVPSTQEEPAQSGVLARAPPSSECTSRRVPFVFSTSTTSGLWTDKTGRSSQGRISREEERKAVWEEPEGNVSSYISYEATQENSKKRRRGTRGSTSSSSSTDGSSRRSRRSSGASLASTSTSTTTSRRGMVTGRNGESGTGEDRARACRDREDEGPRADTRCPPRPAPRRRAEKERGVCAPSDPSLAVSGSNDCCPAEARVKTHAESRDSEVKDGLSEGNAATIQQGRKKTTTAVRSLKGLQQREEEDRGGGGGGKKRAVERRCEEAMNRRKKKKNRVEDAPSESSRGCMLRKRHKSRRR